MTDPASVSHSEDRAKREAGDSDQDWTVLAGHVGEFCEAWEASETLPILGDFAPHEACALRRLALIELVKIDLENRWQRQLEPQRIEWYLEQHQELVEADGGVPNDLIYEEYHVRRQCGDAVGPDEYVRRFPAQAAAICRLLGDHAAESTSLFAGDVVQPKEFGDSIDDFDLITKLGKGAFGSVFLARQRSLQRLVALKITATRSFEAQTLAQLDHPHIVRVHDERNLPERGLRLLYMQYVAGTSLDQLVAAAQERPPDQWSGALMVETLNTQLGARGETAFCERRLSDASWTDVVCRLGIQLASALDYAHGQGVLHRDVKPANILLDAGGSSRLVDFNISYCSKLDGVTPAAYFGGSLAYMSPEQMLACHPEEASEPGDLDARSDVYSLAVVLWELLSGRRPYDDKTVNASWPRTLEAATARRAEPPDAGPLVDLPFDELSAVTDVLQRCLHADPANRIPSASEMARQLRLCLEPATRELLEPRRNLFRQVLLRWPLFVLLLFVLLPNVAAGVFNFVYNDLEIMRQFPQAQDVFWRTQLVINGTAFPIGLLICALVAWPVAAACRSASTSAASSERARQRSLLLGHWGALLGILEWILAGIAYPVAIYLAGISLTPHHGLHFFTSLALCGMIAATYPFFLITAACVLHIYPRMVADSDTSLAEIDTLRRTQRRTRPYLALAAILPLAGITLLVMLGQAQNRFALAVLSLGGLLGFLWVFWQAGRIQGAIGLLIDYIESMNEPLEFLADRPVRQRR